MNNGQASGTAALAERNTRLTIEITSDPRFVRLAAGATRGTCGMVGVPGDRIDTIELCLVEALNNSIQHAYEGRSDEPIEIEIVAIAHEISIEVRDRGRSLPPGTLEDAALPSPDGPDRALADIPESGMGLAIIKSTTDAVSYRCRAEGGGTLRMIWRF